MGSPIAPMDFYRSQYRDFTYMSTRPHHEVLELMQSCDALVLPSIAEGRALVQQEAMANGLPLIVTPNTGGEDLVVEGETGFLVPDPQPGERSPRKSPGWRTIATTCPPCASPRSRSPTSIRGQRYA